MNNNSNLWIAGKSGNENGRPKGSRYSILTTKGRIERFLCKNMSAIAMQRLYNKLSPKEQINMLTELLPYVAAKQTSIDGMGANDVDKVYNDLMEAIQNKNAKAI